MAVRTLTLTTIVSLLVGGIAVAGQPGDASGPAAEKTSNQARHSKDEGRRPAVDKTREPPIAAGAPGVEGSRDHKVAGSAGPNGPR